MLRTFSFAVLLLTVLPAQDDKGAKPSLWLTDFAKAKAQAKAEKKDLLVDFTGSDWCGWCMKLDEEVFSQDAFTASAPKSFVLVKLDYPRKKELPAAEKEQNQKLADEYPIDGYPTIMLMDAEGRVYGLTGYQEGGPDAYLKSLADLKKKGDAYQAAMTTATAKQGAERAKAIDAALATLENDVVDKHHVAAMQEIVKLDADGKAGLKDKYATKAQEIAEGREVDREARALQTTLTPFMKDQKPKDALAKLDEILKAPKGKAQQQAALFFKAMIGMDVDNDAKAAIALLEKAKGLVPKSPIAQQIEMMMPQLQQMAGDKKEEKKDDKKEGGK